MIEEDSAQRQFPCAFCMKAYKRKDHLQRHQKYHCKSLAQRPDFPCKLCPHVASSNFTLKKHLVQCHRNEAPT
ncbi:unnamed protein product [Bemisia tabaci]|uniref:C2H2-type domain-containing protein n=1 Tax=Bemisia tabaci TaxID=7038 RepID=A0A9P0A128_BEMTA|nr:unnamed protein product [Bemisia tabaci]